MNLFGVVVVGVVVESGENVSSFSSQRSSSFASLSRSGSCFSWDLSEHISSNIVCAEDDWQTTTQQTEVDAHIERSSKTEQGHSVSNQKFLAGFQLDHLRFW